MAKKRKRSSNWGGRRQGAGRKPSKPVRGGDHRERPYLTGRHPVLVTMVRDPKLKDLRRGKALVAAHLALGRAANRNGLSLTHYAVGEDHVYLICEPRSGEDLSEGMKGLTVRFSKAINKVWRRKGSIFSERYVVTLLREPEELRRTLARLLYGDARDGKIDSGSSLVWRDTKSELAPVIAELDEEIGVVPPRTKLLRDAERKVLRRKR